MGVSVIDLPEHWVWLGEKGFQAMDALYLWQGLVGGLLTLLAAILAASMVWGQITQVERLEGRRREARQRSARALLPHQLDLALDYAQSGAHYAWDLRQKTIVGFAPVDLVFSPNPPNPPKLTPDLPAKLAASLEALIEPTAVSRLADVLEDLQVVNARLQSTTTNPEQWNASNLSELTVDCLIVGELAKSLYTFARRHKEAAEDVSWGDVRSGAIGADMDGQIHSDLPAQIDQRIEAGGPVRVA